MRIERSTFSESWYRVADLTPRLLGAVNVRRQHFRGVRWYILQAPSDSRFFRLNESAYHFVALLDGRRTIHTVWRLCMDHCGDAAPTQNEVIQLLCQLHGANLLQGNLAPDAAALFKRHRQRAWREVRSNVGNLFFVRIPLWDPDRFLDRWVSPVGQLFSIGGLLLWTAILAAGLWALGGHTEALSTRAAGVLDPENLPLLYAAIVIVKLFHELGHGFACKHFGRIAGSGGEVHQMGVSFLFFTPLPYVDASSAWTLRDKWHRIVISASGMLVELAIAALAAVLWVHTAADGSVNAIAYNIMLIASVSSLAFNGNPFLRYDAYYILLDLLEIPNLESRSKLYVGYLVKRYLWGMEAALDPSHTRGEKGWLVFYAVAATLCRIIILVAIALVLMNMFFSIGTLLAAVLAVRWVLIPLGRFVRFLATGRELGRHRERAILTSALIGGLLVLITGLVPLPDRCRVEGVVEPSDYAVVHIQTPGFVEHVLDTGTRTGPQGPALVSAFSPELEAERARLEAEHRRLQVKRQAARTREAAAVQIMDEKIAALDEQIARAGLKMANLALRAPIQGTWVAPEADRLPDRHLVQGYRLGVVADLDNVRIRAVASQRVASRLIADARAQVEMRIPGHPEIKLQGRIEKIIPAGQEQLPSAALGYTAGGATRIDLDDPSGRQTVEPFFEILVVPAPSGMVTLRPGQTLALRFETSPRTLLTQAWRGWLQLFQGRLPG